MADEIKKSLIIDTGNSVETLGKLRREMAAIVSELEDVEEGSDAFNKLNAQLRATEKEVSKVEGAFGDATDKIKTLSGSGVERFNNSLGLMKEGIKNLDLGKFKIGIQGATQAFGGLKQAIIATGIGALVVAIGLIISNFDVLREKFSGLDKVAKGFEIVMGSIVDFIVDAVKWAGDLYSRFETVFNIIFPITNLLDLVIEGLNEQADKQAEIDRLNAKREADAKKYVENEKGRRDEIKNKYDREIAIAKSLGKSTDELEIKSLKAQKAVIDNQIERIKAFQQTTSLFDSVLGPILEKLTKDQEKAALDIQIKENETLTKRTENYNKSLEDRKKFLDKFVTETEFEKIDREQKEAIAEADRLKVSEEEKLKIKEFYSNKRTELLSKETEAEFNRQQEETKKENERKQKQAEEDANYEEERNKTLEENRKRRSEAKKKSDEEELERERQIRQGSIDIAKGTLDTISSLTELFAGKSKASQKKAFDIQKGVSIAQAGIATFESATKAFNSLSGIPVVGPVLGGVAAAAAVAAGLANIKKIAAQKFDGGGDKSPAPSPSPSNIGAGGSGGSITPPTFNLGGQQIGGAGTLLGSGFGQNGQQPIKVFVSETDISAVQNKVQVTQGNSLFEGPQ
jgi:hypothetical protein